MGLLLVQEVLGRLTADKKPDPERDMLVLAALDGSDALSGYLDGSAARPRPEEVAAADQPPTREPLGAYLKSITVEGFRGIGKKLTLDIPPGPGLTLVVGRNGSGKSTFADALELLLTGDTYRWSHRAKVWKQGWRNLHHKTAAILGLEELTEAQETLADARKTREKAHKEAGQTRPPGGEVMIAGNGDAAAGNAGDAEGGLAAAGRGRALRQASRTV